MFSLDITSIWYNATLVKSISLYQLSKSSPKNDTDAFRCRYHFLLSSKLRDSNKEGAYEVCGRKCFGEAFSPTWQRAKRGDRCGSTGTKSLALMPNLVPLLIQSYRWWYCYFIAVSPYGISGYKNKRCSIGMVCTCCNAVFVLLGM